MYYFIPKRAQRPIYSYRLSIIHFWALIFMYIWAGPHHLHYTALPDWAQTLGMTFSIMLWMPSWGGMINGLMTLSGAWDKLRTDPILRLMVVSLAFYGMSTFEGPMMSIKVVNSLSHYTDWTIGHVHSGALGWVAYVSFGALYCLVPWLWNRREVYSLKLVDWHFWVSTVGIVLYITSMWVAGIMQGLMWRAYNALGLPRILLRRDRRGHAALLPDPGDRRRALPDRGADHGLQHRHDDPRPRGRGGRARLTPPARSRPVTSLRASPHLQNGTSHGHRPTRPGKGTSCSRGTRSSSSSAS